MSRSYKQPYRGSRAFDPSCRNHGSCPYCAAGRVVNTARHEPDLKEQLEDLEEDTWAGKIS